MGKLTVSVIIPTYNRAALLKDTLDSLLAQSRLPDEIIVIDDGSTDTTRELLSHYSAPVYPIYQENQGRSMARNHGLEIAQGDLIAFLDSDDCLPRESISRRAGYLEDHPDIGLVYTDAQLINNDNEKLMLFSERYPVPHPSGRIFAELARRNMIVLSSVMVRRVCLENVTFDNTLDSCEDYDVWLKLAVRCAFAYLAEPLVGYRIPVEEISPQDWGLPGSSHLAETMKARHAELRVLQRALAMPEFQHLRRRQQARIYCAHSAKQSMIGQIAAARAYAIKSIRTDPFHPAGYVLFMLGLLGRRWFEIMILARRRVSMIAARLARFRQ